MDDENSINPNRFYSKQPQQLIDYFILKKLIKKIKIIKFKKSSENETANEPLLQILTK